MRELVCCFLFGMLMMIGQCQVQVPYFGSIKYLKGFTREISGENINYISALPDFATTALLTRCTDGNMAIEWETEVVPNAVKGTNLYFGWLAAYSKNTSHGDRSFDLYINDRKAITFSTYKDRNLPRWIYRGRNGEELVFDHKMDDAVGDAHGFMYLKVPVSSIRKGEPLRLKIIGQKAGSPDWYMTFKYVLAETMVITPVSLLTNDNRQPVQILATHFGEDLPVTFQIQGGETFKQVLHDGLNKFEIFHKAVDSSATITVFTKVKGKPEVENRISLKPVRYREIHLIHHSHYDVGYSDLQPDVENIQNRNISDALRYIKRTRNLPFEARFKWNIETTLALDNFLKKASSDEKNELIRDIKDGYIGIGGLYANILTGLCQPEELFQITSYASQLEKEWGIQIPVVMMSDIPGLTWSVVPALARSGIRYFSDGPNYTSSYPYFGDRVGNSNNGWADKPFWWLSPSGNEKLLFWMAGRGYSSWHGFKAGDIASPRGKKKISDYMDWLDQVEYPYEMVQWRYNIVSDNGPTDSLISQFVLDWNQRYKSPKMILNTVENMFREFEDRYGKKLPVIQGDFTPYWEDGAYSSTLETGMNRRNSEKLTALGTLYSISDPGKFPRIAYDKAWEDILLWDEHTWGAYNSISEPDIPFVTEQWKYKQRYALEADSLVKSIYSPLTTTSGSILQSQMDIYNTTSWAREDIVYLDSITSALLKDVTDESGDHLPFQLLSDGRAAVQLRIPGLSKIRINLFRHESTVDLSCKKPLSSISNDSIELGLDKETGSINSIKYKPLNIELVDTGIFSGANEFLYLKGLDPLQVTTAKVVTCQLKESGDVLSTLQVMSKAPGCNSLVQEITVFKKLGRIEISNTIDKIAVREKESVHFAFPFAIPGAGKRFNTGWGGIFQPGLNQMEGSNQDFYSIQQWCDLSNSQFGISLFVREANLIEQGKIVNEQLGKYGVKSWKTKVDTATTIFSYAMNNYWHTNYKVDQEGKVTLTYALLPHGVFNLAEIQKQGIEFSQPFDALPPSGPSHIKPLFSLSAASIIATSVLPDGNHLHIRLFNVSESSEEFMIRWGSLKASEMMVRAADGRWEILDADAPLYLSAFGIMDVEVESKE